ncbi:receptor-like protein 43 [Papaver somniferum]|uniref:receptor-like protein 43 n=1 Tax=Papaver somniferum TaxID=3469 RepID=UPI000E7013F2|nr:receptor-like protein 43 [Papaver somniferum]
MVNSTLFNTGVISPFPDKISNLTSLSILELVNGQLGGSLPYLPQLTELDVSRNFDLHLDITKMFKHQWPKLNKLWIENTIVTGSIEHLVSNVPLLVSFDASHCSIQGALPSSLSNLSQLKYLDLGHNSIAGDIPTSISNLKHLYHLNLDNNNIQGPIPYSMCEMTALGVLHLGYNNLTGTIPSCIKKLHNLSKFRIINSSIEGRVSFISLVNELSLAAVDLSSNMNLTVVIDQHSNKHPNSKLKMLRMTSTNLEGSPDFICNLPGLVSLDLSRTNLTGTIPSCLLKLKYLNELHLANNKLSGSIPFSIYPTQSDGGILDLSDNKLTGSIRTNIRRGSTLASLNLGNNNLTGIVPKVLEFAKKLQILLLNDNHLEGTINFISGLHSLEYLNLANNNFEGYIPTKLGNLSGLTISNSCFSFFDVGNNQLSLLVKGNLVQLKRFYDYSSVVDLSCNALDGNIPKEIVLVKALSSLNLSHNHFSDDIPENIGDLSALESLDLSSNRLSGNIPQSLTTVDTLGVLNFSYNNLSGTIPRGTHFDTLCLDGLAFIGNDLLCGFPTENFCKGDHNINTTTANTSNKVDENDQDDFEDKLLLYAIIALGFGVGFWGLFLVLLLKKEKWWFPYWRIVNHIAITVTDYIQYQ